MISGPAGPYRAPMLNRWQYRLRCEEYGYDRQLILDVRRGKLYYWDRHYTTPLWTRPAGKTALYKRLYELFGESINQHESWQ